MNDLTRRNLEEIYAQMTAYMALAKQVDPDVALRIRQCEANADTLMAPVETEDDIACLDPPPEPGTDVGDYLIDTLYAPHLH